MWPRTKRPCWKRYEIKMGSQGLLLLIGLKILIIMTSRQNIVILGAQGHLMLMGSKFLTKMTRLQNVDLSISFNVLQPGHLYQKFDPINIRKPWAPETTMFCSEVMMIKIFNPIKGRRPWLPILLLYFSTRPSVSSGPLLFTPEVCTNIGRSAWSIQLYY